MSELVTPDRPRKTFGAGGANASRPSTLEWPEMSLQRESFCDESIPKAWCFRLVDWRDSDSWPTGHEALFFRRADA